MTNTHSLTINAQFDDEGFLMNSNEWNEALARSIAIEDGFGELSKNQFEILHHLREHYFRTGSVTPVRVICHESHLGPYCINELFTSNGIEAWKIARLPNPGEEVKAYM